MKAPFRRAVLLSIPSSLVLVLPLVLAEAGLRLLTAPVESLEVLVSAPQEREPFTHVFQGDPLLMWALKPHLDGVVWNLTPVSTNSEGLRYPRDVGARRPRSVRILCLGDSVTFGFRVPRVPEGANQEAKPYPALVEEALHARNPERQIEVIPLAVPGYSSHQGLAWLQRDIDRYAPDVVIACFGWNDCNRRVRTDRQTMSTAPGAVLIRRVLCCSSQLVGRLALLARRFFPPKALPSSAMSTRVPRDEFVQNMMAIANLARGHRAVPMFIAPIYRDRVTQPHEAREIANRRAALAAAAREAAVAYLEIPELTEDHYPDNDRLFEEYLHPNANGHRLMAVRLLTFLAEQRLLPDLRVESARPENGNTNWTGISTAFSGTRDRIAEVRRVRVDPYPACSDSPHRTHAPTDRVSNRSGQPFGSAHPERSRNSCSSANSL